MDIGNTRTKLGVFHGKTLLEKVVWTDWKPETLLSFCAEKAIERCMVSTVVDGERSWFKRLSERYPTLELTQHTPLPFQNAYSTPETLGKDRLAAVAGAHALYGGTASLVIDCGTCIKYDLLSADGVYLGGNIAPGAQMRQKAMHHFTSRLPEVEMQMPESPVGNSTVTALQNGAFLGATLEIMGFIRLFEAQMAPLHVILTGGDAIFFEPNIVVGNITVEPNLTLIGLNHILSCA